MNTTPKSLRTATLIVALVAAASARAESARFVQAYPVGDRPESVTRGFDGAYYVTVMGQPGPGDASVKVIQDDAIRTFASGLDEPKGIAFVGDHLVTTDLKRVWKIDAQGHKTLLAEEQAFPKPVSYLNDTAAAPDGRSVFVTDMGAQKAMMGANGLWPLGSDEADALPAIGRVYRITLDGEVELVVDAVRKMACPNGVTAPAPGELLVAEFFYGNILRWHDGRLKVLNTGFRGADAIERGQDGSIYVSSWTQGKVWRLDPRGESPKLLIEGMQSAADFYLDETAHRLLVPDMLAGTVVVYQLPED